MRSVIGKEWERETKEGNDSNQSRCLKAADSRISKEVSFE